MAPAACILAAFAASPFLFAGCGSTSGSTTGLPHLSVSATKLTFADQLVGSASTSQALVLSNAGNAPLLLSSATITPSADPAFSLANQCSAPLNPGATCNIVVSFAPPSMGPFAATLAIAGSSNTSATIALNGSGVAPATEFSVSQLTFPGMDVGYTSDPSTLQLSNVGTAPADISGLTISGSGTSAFKLASNSCPQSLAINATCSLAITFTPTSATAYSAVLSIAGNTSQSVALSGTGTPDTPLSAWKNAYMHCRTEPVNILVLGDSRSIVDATINPTAAASLADTFGQKWADRLAATLQTNCGSHGSGLVPFLPGAQAPFLNGDYYRMQGSWTTSFGLGPQQFGSVPANQVLRTTSAAAIQFSVAQPFDHLNAYCVSGPGLNPWILSIDGATSGSCGGNGDAEQATLATSSAVPLGKHTAALTCAVAPCAAYGMETTAGSVGVSVHNLSIGACAAECFGLDPATQLAFSDLIPDHHLVILALITNDPGVGYSPESFAASLGNIIQHERALPTAPSILLYAPLQDNIGGQAPFYPVLSSVANTYTTAFFDLRETYGDAFLPQYFGPDQVHENNDGHAVVYDQVISELTPAN